MFLPRVIRDVDSLRVDVIERVHLRLRFVLDPVHVLRFEVVKHRNVIGIEDRHITVKVLALESVCHNGLVLHTGNILEPIVPQGKYRPLQLPRGGVGAWHRKMP